MGFFKSLGHTLAKVGAGFAAGGAVLAATGVLAPVGALSEVIAGGLEGTAAAAKLAAKGGKAYLR